MVSNSASSTATAPVVSRPRHAVLQGSASNRELRQRVQLFLAQTQRNEMRELEVEAEDGIVILRGKVPTFYARQVAVHSSRRVAGVMRVVDELTVH